MAQFSLRVANGPGSVHSVTPDMPKTTECDNTLAQYCTTKFLNYKTTATFLLGLQLMPDYYTEYGRSHNIILIVRICCIITVYVLLHFRNISLVPFGRIIMPPWLNTRSMWHSGQKNSKQTFPVPRSTCSWQVTTYVGKTSATGQPTRPTQPFILSGSINWIVSYFIGCVPVAPSGEYSWG